MTETAFASRSTVGVLTVDDQEVFRQAARDVIEATPGFEHVGEAASGEEALELVERLRPRLILMDVRMPGLGGIEATRRIVAAHPQTTVVLISIDDPPVDGAAVESCGAVALVRKQEFGPRLLRSIWSEHTVASALGAG